MKYLYILFFVTICHLATVAQVPRKVLPRSVNIMNKDNFAPSLSADGKTMIYLSTYSASGAPELKYTYKTGPDKWASPEDVEEVNKFLELNFIGGFCLSADGNTIYFTSTRGQGIGEYDIMYTEKRGSYWVPAKNLGKPVNSTGHDAAPSISPDGQYLYFMRCDRMSRDEASGCEIWVSKRRNKELWNPPVKLPAPVNTGDDQFPKIFPDNRTLVFSSSRPGGKGGLDFYYTKNQNDSWSKPKPMSFLNSGLNEMFVSLTAKGNEIYFSTDYRGKENIILSKLPPEFQGEKVVVMDGMVVDDRTEDPVKAFIQVYDTERKTRILYTRTDEASGKFYTVFPVGRAYDFSIQSLDKKYLYSAKLYFADSMASSVRENPVFRLQEVRDGLTTIDHNIRFKPRSAELDEASQFEVKRIMKVLKDNPGLNIEIGIHTDRVITDSIQSNEDLTEVRADTIYVFEEYDTLLADNSGNTNPEGRVDLEYPDKDIDLDSLNNSIPRPAIQEIKYTYHNDRTVRQAETLLNHFLQQGVPEGRIRVEGHGDLYPFISGTDSSGNSKNQRVELRFIEY